MGELCTKIKILKPKVNYHSPYTKLFKDSNGISQKRTNWMKVAASGKTDKHMVSILNKGNRVAINGKLVNRSYQDKEGRKQYATEVYANQFINLTPATQKDNLPF